MSVRRQLELPSVDDQVAYDRQWQESEEPCPTPPYGQYASTSRVVLEDTPAYSPAASLNASSRAFKMDVKDVKRPNEEDAKDYGQEIPVRVHYPENLPTLPSPQYLTRRDDSYDTPGGSRAASLAGTTDDEDDLDNNDRYDWSDEDDLVDEEAKFEKQMGASLAKRKRWGPIRIATFFLSTLIGSTLLAGLLVTAPILLKVFWLDPHRNEHREFIWDQVAAWVFWFAANLVLSWYFAFLVDILPAISKLVIDIVWGEVSEYVKTRLELYDSAKNTIKPILYGATGWASWVIIFDSIYHLYDARDESASRASYAPRVYQTVEFLFFLTLLLSAEQMIKHLIAFAFHKKAFQDRIVTLKSQLKVLDHLRAYRPKRARVHSRPHSQTIFRTPVLSALGLTPASERETLISSSPPRTTPELISDDMGIEADAESRTRRSRLRFWHRSASSRATARPSGTPSSSNSLPLNSLGKTRTSPSHTYPPSRGSSEDDYGTFEQNPHEDEPTIAAAAKAIKSTVLHDARNMKRKDDLTNLSSLTWNVSSAHEAKQLARSVYYAFRADRRRTYLVPSDFHPAYATHEAAEEAFGVFDKDGNGDISRAEIKTIVLKVYKERRFLSRSLRDVGVALKTLDQIMILLALIILFFISLSVFRVSLGASLTSVYSLGLGASFIFKNTASNAFDAIIFLFVTHPFDTGDRCFVDSENLVVKKTGLFATTFTRSDGTTSYYFNSQLFGKFITNIRRSGKQAENLTMQVSWRTPLEKLDQLEKCMNEWLQTEQNRWFTPGTSCNLQHIDFQKSMEITMGIPHNGTWQDWGLRNARKTAFHAAVRFYCRQLGIICHNSPQPIFFSKDAKQIMSQYEGTVDPDSNLTDALREMQGSEVKPMLGFLPPAEKRNEMTSLRARKSKNRKAMRTELGGD